MIVQRLKALEGTSIREVARIAGVSHATVLSIRDGVGNPTLKTVVQVERALDYIEHRSKDRTEEVQV